MRRTSALLLAALLILCLFAGVGGCRSKSPVDSTSEGDLGNETSSTASAEAPLAPSDSSATTTAIPDGVTGAASGESAAVSTPGAAASAGSGGKVTGGSSSGPSAGSGGKPTVTGGATGLAIGKTVTCGDLRVTLTAASAGPKDTAGRTTYKLAVRYENIGSATVSYNQFDWFLADGDGRVSQEHAIVAEDDDSLGSGELSPKETVQGTIHLAPPAAVASVHYIPVVYACTAAWMVR